MRNASKYLMAAALCGSMSLMMLPAPIFAAEEDAHPTEKSETVYSFIEPDGTVKETLVSSWIHDEDGIDGVEETLELSDVKNVKTDEEPQVKDKTYTWSVNGNDVYYQGTTQKKLPVNVKIDYTLDGKSITPDKLAGKSGHLKMTVHFDSEVSKQVEANGKTVTIHPAFLSAGLLDLDNEIFSNIKCEQGKSINDGSHEFLAFAAIPGLNGTLADAGLEKAADKLPVSDEAVIEADVKNFEVPEMYIGMTNDFDLKEMDSIDSLIGQFSGISQLFSAADQLEEGSAKLADGTDALKTGIAPLGQATGKISILQQAFDQLNNGAGSLEDGITAYTNGVAQLDGGISQLSRVDLAMKQIQDGINKEDGLKNGSTALSNGMKTFSENLSAVNRQVQAINMDDIKGLGTQLEGGLKQIEGLKTSLSQAQGAMSGMKDTLGADAAKLAGLKEAMNNAKTALASLSSQAQAIGAAEQNALGTIAKDNEIAAANNAKIANASANLNAQRESALAAVNNAIASLQAAKGEDADLNAKLDEQINALSAQSAALSNPVGVEEMQSFDSFDSVAAALQSAYGPLNETLNGLSSSMESAAGTLEGLSSDLDNALAALQGMSTQLEQAEATLKGLAAQLDGVSNSDQIKNLEGSLMQLKGGMNKLDEAGQSLSAGSAGLDQGIDILNAGLSTLETQSSQAFTQLKDGSSKLNDNSTALKDGAGKLHKGTETLNAQSSQLNQLKDGVSTLENAVSQLNDGAHQLADGTKKFQNEGMKPLEEKLQLTESEAKAFESLVNEITDFNKENSFFAGAPEGARTKVKYIYKVEADTDNKDEQK